MSHFVTMVIGNDPEAQLAPYNEQMQVDEYIDEELTEHDKQMMLDYYNQRRETPYESFDDCYAEHGEDWDGSSCRKNEAGVWCRYTTYNPQSKWDWYLLGGGWSGKIIKLKKEATSGIIGVPSWCSTTNGVDAALKKDIDFKEMDKDPDCWIPYAVVKDAKWLGRGNMGWWGISTDDAPLDEWAQKVRELVESLPDDTLISFYDCHI